jgi:hypothetical protein
MAKKPNGAGNGAPKKAGPPANALHLGEATIDVYERLTEAELGQAKAQHQAEKKEREASRKAIAELKEKLKTEQKNELARSQRAEGLADEIATGKRKVPTIVARYMQADGQVHHYDPKTWEEVGEPTDPTPDDRQGVIPGSGKVRPDTRALPPKSASPAPYDLETTGEGLDEEGGEA